MFISGASTDGPTETMVRVGARVTEGAPPMAAGTVGGVTAAPLQTSWTRAEAACAARHRGDTYYALTHPAPSLGSDRRLDHSSADGGEEHRNEPAPSRPPWKGAARATLGRRERPQGSPRDSHSTYRTHEPRARPAVADACRPPSRPGLRGGRDGRSPHTRRSSCPRRVRRWCSSRACRPPPAVALVVGAGYDCGTRRRWRSAG